MNERLGEIRLYGHLRGRFQKTYRMAVKSPGEAVRALCCAVPGFRQYLAQHSEPGYRVVVDKTPIQRDEEFHHPSGAAAIRIVPVVAGAASGLGKILTGAALIGISYFIPGSWSWTFGSTTLSAASIGFNLGLSMVLGGISQMLSGTQRAPTPTEKANNQPSFAFNGPVNVTAQGQPVPVCYGKMRVGSVVISSGLSTSQLAV